MRDKERDALTGWIREAMSMADSAAKAYPEESVRMFEAGACHAYMEALRMIEEAKGYDD